MKSKSGLLGWKYSKTVSVPPKPSHGKLSNTSKISTQTRITNFEVKSVAQNSENIPPKISVGGGGSSGNLQQVFRNNSNGERLNLSAGNLSSELKQMVI